MKNKLHTSYNRILFLLGLQTPLLFSIFALPLSISFFLSVLCLCLVQIPLLFAFGIGLLASLIALILGIRFVMKLLHYNSSIVFIFFLMQIKVLVFALLLVVCYTLFNFSIFALLLGFITPLAMLSIQVYRLYMCNTIMKEI